MDEPKDEKKAKVSQISEARKRKKNDVLKPPQIAELFAAIAAAINRECWSVLPPFKRRLVVYSAATGMRVAGELGEGDVVTIHNNDVAVEAAIMDYCNKELLHLEDFRWTAKHVRDCRDFWVMATKPLTDVKAYRWQSEAGYTFNRLPWDLHGAKDLSATPTWDRLLSRTTNREALRKWIGSLFVEDSDTHQYVWVHGQGSNGKGAINRFLARVFGGAYCAKQPPKGDKFWTFGLIGKRLVAFPDCNDVTFVTSGLFKSLTGGDPVDAEAKGKMNFTFKPFAKYFFFSNEKPKISSEKADTRRIIYCEFDANEAEVEAGFEQRLWDEGGAFLTNCIVEYAEAHPNHGPIKCNDELIQEHLSVVEERFEVIYEKHFVKMPVTTSDLNKLEIEKLAEQAVLPRRMQEILGLYFRNNNQVGEFIQWLEIKHRVKKKTLALADGREPKVYVGLAERGDWPEKNEVDGRTRGRPTDGPPVIR